MWYYFSLPYTHYSKAQFLRFSKICGNIGQKNLFLYKEKLRSTLTKLIRSYMFIFEMNIFVFERIKSK